MREGQQRERRPLQHPRHQCGCHQHWRCERGGPCGCSAPSAPPCRGAARPSCAASTARHPRHSSRAAGDRRRRRRAHRRRGSWLPSGGRACHRGCSRPCRQTMRSAPSGCRRALARCNTAPVEAAAREGLGRPPPGPAAWRSSCPSCAWQTVCPLTPLTSRPRWGTPRPTGHRPTLESTGATVLLPRRSPACYCPTSPSRACPGGPCARWLAPQFFRTAHAACGPRRSGIRRTRRGTAWSRR